MKRITLAYCARGISVAIEANRIAIGLAARSTVVAQSHHNRRRNSKGLRPEPRVSPIKWTGATCLRSATLCGVEALLNLSFPDKGGRGARSSLGAHLFLQGR